jgi:succinate dehydrogenase hydrophobic anchor subunit
MAAMLHFVPALIGFGALLGVATRLEWYGADLVWAIYASGIAMTAYAAFLLPFLDENDLPAKLAGDRRFPLLIAKHVADTAVSGLVGAAFFGGAIGLFMFWPLGLLLNSLVPLLWPDATGIAIYIEACAQYWPAALICCAAQTPSIARAMAQKQPGGNKIMLFLLGEALTVSGVILIALVIVMLGGVLGQSVKGLADYILMALLLLPWSMLWGNSRDKAGSNAGLNPRITVPPRKH